MINYSPPVTSSYKSAQRQVPFGAGKVYLWMDHDGTMLPYTNLRRFEKEINKPGVNLKLNRFYNKFRELLTLGKGDIQLNVSTGRNYDSYTHSVSSLHARGIDYVMPQRVATSEGGELYHKSIVKKFIAIVVAPVKYLLGMQRNVSGVREGSFKPYIKDSGKIQSIKKQTRWNLSQVQSVVTDQLEKAGIQVIDGKKLPAEVSSKEFITGSMQAPLAFIENSGELSCLIRFKPDHTFNKTVFDEVSRNIMFALKDLDMKYFIKTSYKDRTNWGRPVIRILPVVNNRPLDKSCDIEADLKKAKANDDLVIVAGDYINDIPMLNPATYSSCLNPEEQPMVSIAINHPERERYYNPVVEMARKPHNKGKILITDPFSLPHAIKRAIKLYADKNDTFKKALHPDFLKLIEETSQ